MANRAAHIVNWQERARSFSVGDVVYPFTSDDVFISGRVVAVFPAIGMVDVEYPNGTKRHAVEDLQRYEGNDVQPPNTENVPGGAGTVSVPGGPEESAKRVAKAFVKKSLYWAAKNRQYRATKGEVDAGRFHCPKCKESALRRAVYKRSEDVSERLLACPSCTFLIKACDIIGHPAHADLQEKAKDPLARLRVQASEEV